MKYRTMLILFFGMAYIPLMAQMTSFGSKLNDFVIENGQSLQHTFFVNDCESPEVGVIIFQTHIKNIHFAIWNEPDALVNVKHDERNNQYILCLKPLGDGRKYQINITRDDYNGKDIIEPTISASENRVYKISDKRTSRLKKIIKQSIIGIKADGGMDVSCLKNEKGSIIGNTGIWKAGVSYLYPNYNLEEEHGFLFSTGINFGNNGFVDGRSFLSSSVSSSSVSSSTSKDEGVREKLSYNTLDIPISIIMKTDEEWFVQLGIQNNFNFRQTYKNNYVEYNYKSFVGNSIVKPYTMDVFGGIGYISTENHFSVSLTYTRSLMNQFNKDFTQTINGIEIKPLQDAFLAKNAITLSIAYYFGNF